MSTTRKTRIGLAVGLFMVLSVVVFGSIFYVGFTSVNTEIVVVNADVDNAFPDGEGVEIGDYFVSRDSNWGIRRGPIEIVPDQRWGIIRGPIEILPDYAPFFRRGPIEIVPE